jgi:hypothetical protein
VKYWRSSPLVFSFVPRCQGPAGRAGEVDTVGEVLGEQVVVGRL